MKAYIMGNYTEKAFQGFLKDLTSDRKAMQDAGYKNGDPVDGEMFPTLYSLS